MKKFLSIVLALVMMFSVAALSVSAVDAEEVTESVQSTGTIDGDVQQTIDSAKDIYDDFTAQDYEGVLYGVFGLAKNIATTIHTIVHTFAKLFIFDCPFCTDVVTA